MMSMVIHQMQGFSATFSLRPLPWSKGLKMKHYVITGHTVGRTDRCFLLKRNLSLSVGASHFCGPRVKPLKISAFKGRAQKDVSGSGASGSKVLKNSTKPSYIPKENEESITESPKAHNLPLSYMSGANEIISGSPAIHKLFKKWLTMLTTHSPIPEVDELLGECSPQREILETLDGSQSNEGKGILKVVWSHFLTLDATIKIPLLIFIPMYLAVNMIYGAEVSKELMPLWVLGPLIVALYIKMLQGLCALYVWSFKQTVKVVKNLPAYYLMGYNYIVQGNLKEDVSTRILQPVIEDIKTMDYKRKLEELKVWMVEKYLDFIESIWPFYCRTIRFLKTANLI